MPSFHYTCVSLITHNPDNISINISAYAEFFNLGSACAISMRHVMTFGSVRYHSVVSKMSRRTLRGSVHVHGYSL